MKKAGNGPFDRSQNMGPNCGNFLDILGQSVALGTDLGCLYDNLWNKLCFGVYKTGNGYGIRFQKVKPRLDEWAAHGQPTAGFRDC